MPLALHKRNAIYFIFYRRRIVYWESKIKRETLSSLPNILTLLLQRKISLNQLPNKRLLCCPKMSRREHNLIIMAWHITGKGKYYMPPISMTMARITWKKG